MNSGIVSDLRSFLFKNNNVEQTVAKNTFWLSVSNFGGRLLKAVVIILAARILGTSSFGVFSYAVTLAGFFTLFVDPGINAMLMKQGARTEGEERLTLLSTTFYIKLTLTILCIIFVLLVGPYFTILPGAKFLLPVVALIILGDTMREFFSSFIRAREKMELETAIFMFTNLAIVVIGFIALIIAPTALGFGWAYAAGTTIGAVAALFVLREYLYKAITSFSSKLVMPVLRSAWPFAITGALGALLTNADILIISWLLNASDVGIYSSVIRIIQLLYLIPTVIVQYSIIPVFARFARKDDARFRQALERILAFVFSISIPLALGGLVLGTQIMVLIFGAAYGPGGWSLRILMLTMLADYPAAIISSAIFAYEHQKSLIITSSIAGFSNVALDLLLIPRYGIVGSAVATLIAQTLCALYMWHVLRKINYFKVLPRLKNIMVASVFMSCVTLLLYLAHVEVVLTVIAAIVVYIAVLKALREPLVNDVIRIMFPSRASK